MTNPFERSNTQNFDPVLGPDPTLRQKAENFFGRMYNTYESSMNKFQHLRDKYRSQVQGLEGELELLGIGGAKIASALFLDTMSDYLTRPIARRTGQFLDDVGMKISKPSLVGTGRIITTPTGPFSELKRSYTSIPKRIIGDLGENSSRIIGGLLEDQTDMLAGTLIGKAIKHKEALPSKLDSSISRIISWGSRYLLDDKSVRVIDKIVSPLSVSGARNILEATGRIAYQMFPGIPDEIKAQHKYPATIRIPTSMVQMPPTQRQPQPTLQKLAYGY